MKSENLVLVCELVRALTPCLYGAFGSILIFIAIVNSERLIGDRFAYVIGTAGAVGAAGAGGFSPQNNRQSQNRISADQVDIDQSK